MLFYELWHSLATLRPPTPRSLLSSSTDPSANSPGHLRWLSCHRCCNSSVLLLGADPSDSWEYNWSHPPHHHLRWMHLMLLHSERGTKSNPPSQKYLIIKLKEGVKTADYSLAAPSSHLRKPREWHHTSWLSFCLYSGIQSTHFSTESVLDVCTESTQHMLYSVQEYCDGF